MSKEQNKKHILANSEELDSQKDDKQLISESALAAAKEVVNELRKQNMLKEKQSPFQKTETLLYNYYNFKDAVDDKMSRMRTILDEGLSRKSSSISSFSKQPVYEMKNDSDKAEEKIEELMNSVQETEQYITLIDDALSKIQDDKYFGIIQMKYFEGKTREEIADEYGKDVKTITRNKNRLINKLQIHMFANEYLKQMFC